MGELAPAALPAAAPVPGAPAELESLAAGAVVVVAPSGVLPVPVVLLEPETPMLAVSVLLVSVPVPVLELELASPEVELPVLALLSAGAVVAGPEAGADMGAGAAGVDVSFLPQAASSTAEQASAIVRVILWFMEAFPSIGGLQDRRCAMHEGQHTPPCAPARPGPGTRKREVPPYRGSHS